MNKFKLLLFAGSPLLIGYLMSYATTNFGWIGIMPSIVGVLFLIYWYCVGYKSYDYVKTRKDSMLIGNSFAISSMILMIFLPYLIGYLATPPQMFFLPLVRVSTWIQTILSPIIIISSSVFQIFLTFILMIILYYLGYSNRVKRDTAI